MHTELASIMTCSSAWDFKGIVQKCSASFACDCTSLYILLLLDLAFLRFVSEDRCFGCED